MGKRNNLIGELDGLEPRQGTHTRMVAGKKHKSSCS